MADETHAVIEVNNLPSNQPFDFVLKTNVPLNSASIHIPIPFVGPVHYSYLGAQASFIYYFTIASSPASALYLLVQLNGTNGNLTFQVNGNEPSSITYGEFYNGNVSLNQIRYYSTNYIPWESPGFFAVELNSPCAQVFITANGDFPDLLNGEGQTVSVNSSFQLLVPVTELVDFRIGVLGTESCSYSLQTYFGM